MEERGRRGKKEWKRYFWEVSEFRNTGLECEVPPGGRERRRGYPEGGGREALLKEN